MKVLYRGVLLLILLTVFVSTSPQVTAQSTVITFEGQGDGTAITSQYNSLGVNFVGATVATAGLTLNEIEFPPVSGSNVVFDDGGPMTGMFNQPVVSYGGYFTYSSRLTLTAYNQSGSVLGTTTSTFTKNFTSSGNHPNQFLSITNSAGISSFSIVGDPNGGSFALDNFTFTPGASPVPEPCSLLPFVVGCLCLAGLLWHRNLRQKSR